MTSHVLCAEKGAQGVGQLVLLCVSVFHFLSRRCRVVGRRWVGLEVGVGLRLHGRQYAPKPLTYGHAAAWVCLAVRPRTSVRIGEGEESDHVGGVCCLKIRQHYHTIIPLPHAQATPPLSTLYTKVVFSFQGPGDVASAAFFDFSPSSSPCRPSWCGRCACAAHHPQCRCR